MGHRSMAKQLCFTISRLNEAWHPTNQISDTDLCEAVSNAVEQARDAAFRHPKENDAVFPRSLRKKRRFTCIAPAGEQSVFVKGYIFSRLRERLLLHLGVSKPAKAFASALRLQDLGIPCATPIALAKNQDPLVLALVTEAFQEGTTLGRFIRQKVSQHPFSLDELNILIDAFAAFVARLHQLGIYHADFHRSTCG
jgi:hypothetical protein